MAEVESHAAVGITREQAVTEASRCLMCNEAPCEQACPANVKVTTFIRRLRFGDFGAALRKIIEANVLAGTCGMACPKGMLCEEACVLRPAGRSIQIRDLQLSAHLLGLEEAPQPGRERGASKVAVIGGGPAGLACAYYLKRLGIGVTLYEKADVLGGMLTRGIPEYRIAGDVVRKEIAYATDGIQVVPGARVQELSHSNLKKQGFAAAFLATGLWESSFPQITGGDLEGVYDGSLLLRDLARTKTPLRGIRGRVAVIGGGNTACDVALSLKRYASSDVTVFYRRTRDEMPAFAHEINDALIDGVKFEFLTAPVAVRGKGKVEELHLVRTRLGDADVTGRPRPVPVDGSEFTFPCNCVVFATGGVLDSKWLDRAFGVKIDKSGRVAVSPDTLMTSVEGVFAGGDLSREKGLVVEAVSDGRRAALSIARYLGEQA